MHRAVSEERMAAGSYLDCSLIEAEEAVGG